MSEYTSWKHDKADIFWGDMASTDHVVQIYENEGVFIDTLAGFVSSGIHISDCCVIIATDAHLKALNERLESYGASVAALITDDGYMPYSAEEMLSRMVVNRKLDHALMVEVGSAVILKARKTQRPIRMFGEVSALLWASGDTEGAMHMEHMANLIPRDEKFCLYCAYPRSMFTRDIKSSRYHICGEHSKEISGTEKQLTEVYYRDRATA